MNSKKMKKAAKKRSPIMTMVKTATLLLSLYYSLAMPVLAGAGLICNRKSYGAEMEKTGIFLIIAASLMTSGVVLCLFRKELPNMLSPFFSVGGLVLCMVMLSKLISHADQSGWTDKYSLQPISGMYKIRLLPCIIPVVLSAAIAAVQLCSSERSDDTAAKSSGNSSII